jgi:hypothetical protein
VVRFGGQRLCTLRYRVARLLQLASEVRATGRNDVAHQFTERAAQLLARIVSEDLARRLATKENPGVGAGNLFSERFRRCTLSFVRMVRHPGFSSS